MAIPGNKQALISAFAFGFVVNAASAALFLSLKGHGSNIFRDGLRLVLVTFLAGAALWAQIDFIATVLDPTASSACQVVVAFAAGFDQMARLSLEQYLQWAVNKGTTATAWTIISQTVLLVRFVLGAVFIGLSRPQTAPVCVARTSVLPIGIAVVAIDGFLILLLATRAMQVGLVSSAREGKLDAARGKAVLAALAGMAIWTGASVPMLLGISSIDYIFRTTIPAVALAVLVGIVTAFTGALVLPSRRPKLAPEALSPRQISTRDLSTADSDYPPSQYEDLKGDPILRDSAFIAPREAPRPGGKPNTLKGLPTISQPARGLADAGMGGVPVQGQLFPPPRFQAESMSRSEPAGTDISRSESRGGVRPKKTIRFEDPKMPGSKIAISNPILQDGSETNPLKKIATIDLATAMKNERERRDQALLRSSGLIAKRPAPQPPTMTPEEQLKRASSVRRKEVASTGAPPPLEVPPATLMPVPRPTATTTSAKLSPGVEEVRRRSPRQAPETFQQPKAAVVRPPPVAATGRAMRAPSPEKREPKAPEPPKEAPLRQDSVKQNIRPSRQRPVTPPPQEPEPELLPVQKIRESGLPRNPRAQAMTTLTKEAGTQRQQTVMFVNTIEYNDPGAVESIIRGANDMAKAAKSPGEALKSGNSVVNRPRPIPRNRDKDRGAFPAEPSPSASTHRRSKSGGSVVSNRKSILQSNAGSPTQLPPLPPPPVPAGGTALRPLPNDTKSMTFDEKMNLLFPGSNRRSSVPDIPAMPSSFLDIDETAADTDRRQSGRSSERTSKASSVQTQNILDIEDLPLPPINVSKFSMDTVAMTEATTTVHSPVAAVNIRSLKQLPKTTYIQRNEPSRQGNKSSWIEGRDGKESMTIMLDPTTPHDRDFNSRASWVDESDMPMLGGTRQGGNWHRRVGDDCPTFSDRKEKIRSRKMPPPTPLLLNLMSNKNAIIVATEPSPLESPQEALNAIQAQLKKLDQKNRESVGSPSRRLALLENLELEMGQQEDHWLEMQHDMGRDSVSTFKTSPGIDGLSGDPREASRNLADRRASRRARMRSGSGTRLSTDMATASSQSSDNTRASMWQQRLAEAQVEYMDNAPELIARRNVNFLAVSRLPAQLGSPTPPDTDESDTEDQPSLRLAPKKIQLPYPESGSGRMWTPSATNETPTPSTAVLWTPGSKPPPSTTEEEELPGLSVRPVSRRSSEMLSIESNQLWKQEADGQTKPRPSGLWKDSTQQAQKAPRPVTQRPPRRSKRVTLLPDILESPEPLPNKRGTLGIFQFPWGEKSDTATIQARPSNILMAMPGTMASGAGGIGAALDARAKMLASQEYSSSFFDDYDEDEEDVVSDLEEEGSDDGFDENTLWEIASLLKTNQVPSKNSLFPQGFKGQSTFVEEDDEEEVSDDEPVEDLMLEDLMLDDMEDRDSIVVGIETESFPMPPPKSQPAPPPRRDSLLWEGKTTVFGDSRGSGLPQPDQTTWQSYLPAANGAVRGPTRSMTAESALVQSDSLWNASQKPSHGRPVSHLWSRGMSMWSAPIKTKFPEPRGLFSTRHMRSEFRTTAAEPAALRMTRKPRVSHEPMPRLTSWDLWQAKPISTQTRHWISAARMAPKPAVARETAKLPATQYEPTRRERKAPAVAAQPVHRQHRPTITFRADWDAALQEAIDASYPERLRRRSATRAEWDAALQEAISASRPGRATATEWDAALQAALTQTLRHDVTKRHPVFAASSLITKSPWFHPAATGYTYDPARVNPVFFGSLAVSTENVHPAMSAWASRKLRRQASKLERSGSSRSRRAEEAEAEAPAAAAAAAPARAPSVKEASAAPARHPSVKEASQNPLERTNSRSRTAARAVGSIARRVAAREGAAAAPAPRRQKTQLWSREPAAPELLGAMWMPQPKPAGPPAAPAPATADAAAESAPRHKRKPKDRKEEIRGQIAAIERGAEPASLGLGFATQNLWSRYDGHERLPKVMGGGHNWLADSSRPKVNRVQFRY